MMSEAAKTTDEYPLANANPGPGDRPNWRHSLLGKVAVFMMLCVFLAYAVGAGAGFFMLERGSREQWRNQAAMNAQTVSSVMRGIYTALAVETDPSGQVVRVISELPIGDETSILTTGFDPVDVLSLASAQTKHAVWLLQPDAERKGFVSTADSEGGDAGVPVVFTGEGAPSPQHASFFVGSVVVNGEEHMVSVLPVTGLSGQLHGLLVSSIGRTDDLLKTRNELVRQSLVVLVAVLAMMTALVAFLMRQLFRPVPVLIQALTRIADNDTGVVTPFQGRDDEIGRLAYAIETLREAVVEREHLREAREATLQFEYMAHHDHLTGLPNRARLNKALDKAMDALPTGQQANFLMLDLDHFKQVNDTHGHAVGDALLVAVSGRLSLLLGPDDIAVRLGGDEFAVLQKVSQDAEKEASRLAARIVEALCTPFAIDHLEVQIGASVGIACAPVHGQTAHALLTRSDIALYASKRGGRSAFAFYSDDLAEESRCGLAVGA